jgi:hypothetical protein
MENEKFNDTKQALLLPYLQQKGGGKMAEQKFESPVAHWQSRVECITGNSQPLLANKLNEFYVGKFVVGTQVFRSDDGWTALVYYKVKG